MIIALTITKIIYATRYEEQHLHPTMKKITEIFDGSNTPVSMLGPVIVLVVGHLLN